MTLQERLGERLGRFSTWFFRLGDPALEAEEALLLGADAWRKPGVDRVFGRLFLTTARIVFLSERARLFPAFLFFPGNAPMRIPLSAVQAAALLTKTGRFEWYPKSPNVEIVLRDGRKHRFLVADPHRWIDNVNRLANEARQASESTA